MAMNISAAIFDTDGTLIESMYVWETAASECVRSYGKEPKEDIDYRALRLSTAETSKIIVEEYGVNAAPEEVRARLEGLVLKRYENEVPIKDAYVREFLEELKSKGIPMCVATGTARPLIVSALRRLDLLKYFEDVISTIDTGVNKHHPDVYLKVAELLGADDMSKVAVFEDAKYAAKTAVDAGFYVTGIYSDFFSSDREEMESFCNNYVTSFSELLGKFEKINK